MVEQTHPSAAQPDSQGQGDAQVHPAKPIREATRNGEDQQQGKQDAPDGIVFVHFDPAPIQEGGADETRSEEQVPSALGEARKFFSRIARTQEQSND